MRVCSFQSARSQIPGSRSIQLAVRVLDVVGRGCEDVEDQPPVGREVALDRAQHRAAIGVGLHVQHRPERDEHERERALDRRVAHVAVAQVELGADLLRALARDLQHPLREVDADDRDPARGDRDGDPPGADGELEHRPAAAARLVEIEGHVLDDAARPRVVEAGDLVVGGHGAMLSGMNSLAITSFMRPRCSGRGVR